MLSRESTKPLQYFLDIFLTLFILSILILGASKVYAEKPELFTPLPADQLNDVNLAQTRRIDQIKQRPTTASVTLVQVNTSVLTGNSVRMSLPGAKTLDFSQSRVETKTEKEFIWVGSLPNVPGAATLVVRGDKITGTIRDGQDLYKIEQVSNGVHALTKVDETRFPPDEPPSTLSSRRISFHFQK